MSSGLTERLLVLTVFTPVPSPLSAEAFVSPPSAARLAIARLRSSVFAGAAASLAVTVETAFSERTPSGVYL